MRSWSCAGLDAGVETVTGYSFRHDDLRAGQRPSGISAFMRIRNGADFLEATIRSHIDAFDEIVAVYNQCTDATPDILARLAGEFGPKLRIFHYADRVHPPGSAQHAAEAANSPNSLVNYYNFALSRTSYALATKLDDDHLAIAGDLGPLCARLRSGAEDTASVMHCFSGVNLARDRDGRLGTPASDMISGGGDIGFFRVGPETYFDHDKRFERFRRGGLKRRFAGFLYWHLKYLKEGQGFANYELERNPSGRYARRLRELGDAPVLGLARLRRQAAPSLADRLLAVVSGKRRLVVERNRSLAAAFPQETLEDALDATSPDWREWLAQPA